MCYIVHSLLALTGQAWASIHKYKPTTNIHIYQPYIFTVPTTTVHWTEPYALTFIYQEHFMTYLDEKLQSNCNNTFMLFYDGNTLWRTGHGVCSVRLYNSSYSPLCILMPFWRPCRARSNGFSRCPCPITTNTEQGVFVAFGLQQHLNRPVTFWK